MLLSVEQAAFFNKTGSSPFIGSQDMKAFFGPNFPFLSSNEALQGVVSTFFSCVDEIKNIQKRLIANELKKIKFLLHTSPSID